MQQTAQTYRGSLVVCRDREHAPDIPYNPLRTTVTPFLKICLQGSFLISSEQGHHRITGGEACLFVPGSVVNDSFPDPCRFFRLNVADDLVQIGQETIDSRGRSEIERCTIHQAVSPCARAIIQRLAAQPAAEHASHLLRGLLGEIADVCQLPLPAYDGDQRLREVLIYLREHCCYPIDRNQVARAMKISPTHLSRLFQRYSPTSFQQVLTDLRLQHAMRLLRQTNATIAEVAERSGFTSGNYFAQAFRAQHGQSPSQWRKQGQGKNIKWALMLTSLFHTSLR